MSTIQLSNGIEVEPEQIASVAFEEKGAKISSKVVSVSSGDWQDLRVPEDSVIVRLHDGAEFIVRGEQEAKQAWQQLDQIKKQQSLSFAMDTNKRE